MTLLDLAAKVEAAEGPDRELDAEIAVAVSGDPHALVVTPGPDCIFSHQPGWWATGDDKSHSAPAYTSSVDAAMMLVPDGWRLAALCQRSPWFVRLETDDFDSITCGRGEDWTTDVVMIGKEVMATAATPALALTAASLRARSENPA